MTVVVRSPDEMRRLAARIAGQCRAGDVIVLSGGLGAGKTTFTQGLGRALGVLEPITSPTFVISRVHRVAGAPGLVHVDAYRVGSVAELDDLDIDADLAECITVVEWGDGVADRLSPDWLHIRIEHGDIEHGDIEHGDIEHGDIEHGDMERGDIDDVRVVTLTPHGTRWQQVPLAQLEQESP